MSITRESVGRSALGVIVPSVNTVMEEEFHNVVPDHVSVHWTRIPYQGNDVDGLQAMNSYVVPAAELLADAGVNLIVYGCTLGSMVGGPDQEQALIDSCERVCGVTVLMTGVAVREALSDSNSNSVAVITPYEEIANETIVRYLEASDIEVGCVSAIDIPRPLGQASHTTIERLVKGVNPGQSDCMFLSCTGLRTRKILSGLARDFGRPVVSSNSATIWASLRQLSVEASNNGLP